MLWAEAECLFLGFILYASGVQGRADRICALKGSSVDVPCSLPTSSINWYTVRWDGQFLWDNVSADGYRTKYNVFGASKFTLTIKDLRENDTNFYCCGNTDNPVGYCWYYRTKLQVTDLQVKVIPSTEGHTVTLMCSTSCPLTENPAAYIWYKNREFLYEDWSPWYQQLVSSEEAVRYSCAIKGYEDLRAPEVSVDSVTSTCFSVTYAEGRMCSYVHASVDEPCSITYPTEVSIQSTSSENDMTYRLTCTPNCPLTDNQTAYRWYKNKHLYKYSESQHFTADTLGVSCAVKGHEDLSAAEVCNKDTSCSSENYVSRRICAVEGSSVNIPDKYFPHWRSRCKKAWFKMKRSGEDDAEELAEDAGRLEYRDNMDGSYVLRIKKLRKDDSAEYAFRCLDKHRGWKWSDYPGVTLVVTGLKVTFTPSAVVTEGQRVTLTCNTSCPLNTNYTWYLNGRPLTLPENQNNKQLVLETFSQHAGNYSCAVNSENNKISPEVTLTVLEAEISMAMINAMRLAVAPLIPIPLLVFHLWMSWTRP